MKTIRDSRPTFLWAFLCLLFAPFALVAQEGATDLAPDVATDVTETAEAGSAEMPPDADKAEQKESTMIGLMMITLICLTGVFLIIWILLYGRALRRLSRRRSAPIHTPDPLWYLKSKDGTGASANDPHAAGNLDKDVDEEGGPTQ